MSGATAKETVPGAIRSLSAKASRTKDARVRVVVGYRVPFAPEARLNGANRSKQQQEIAAAGERLRKNYANAARRKAGLRIQSEAHLSLPPHPPIDRREREAPGARRNYAESAPPCWAGSHY
jgi:hypothetical protein